MKTPYSDEIVRILRFTNCEKCDIIYLQTNNFEAIAEDWTEDEAGEWGVPSWNDDNAGVDIDSLFEPSNTSKEKPLSIMVEIPLSLNDKLEDIRAAIRLTVEEWEGVIVK